MIFSEEGSLPWAWWGALEILVWMVFREEEEFLGGDVDGNMEILFAARLYEFVMEIEKFWRTELNRKTEKGGDNEAKNSQHL